MKHAFYLSSVIGLALLGAGCSHAQPFDADRAWQETPVPSFAAAAPEQVVDAMTGDTPSSLRILFNARESNGQLWWIVPGEKNVLIKDVPVRAVVVSDSRLTQDLVSRVDRVMLGNGFKKDELNSSKDLRDFSKYDIVEAYQKDKTICALVLNGDFIETETPVNFLCSDTDKLAQASAEQLPFLQIVHNPYDKTDANKDAVISDIRYFPPSFAVVAVNHRRTGYSTILKKIRGVYIQVYAGQEAPYCKVVDQYAIPKEVVPECYQSGGTTMKVNTH